MALRGSERWGRLAGRLAAHPRAVALLLAVGLLAAMLRGSWVGDDAYITFRSVESLAAGNGPRWNPHERVQAFTHPLWFGALALGRALCADLYRVALALNLGFSIGAAWVLLRSCGARPARMAWLAALLASSKAWLDYATSGLENPLSYFLLACFLVAGLRWLERPAAGAGGALAALSACGLLALNRLDALALVLPPLALLLWRARETLGIPRTARALSLAALPLLLWTGFAVAYYGFPLPNTAYAKLGTGIPWPELARQALLYFANSLRWDPLTLPAIALAAAVGALGSNAFWRAVALGLLLHLLYVVWIGGDFMSGRFLSLPLLTAALLLAHRAPRPARWGLAGAMLVLPLLSPLHPLRFPDHEKLMDAHGVADERSYYAAETSLGTCLSRWRGGEPCPDHLWLRAGRAFGASGERVAVRRAIGFFGYAAGLDAIVVDRMALADPLLARLPVDGPWRVGHFPRELPEGYLETLETGRNRLRDPRLRERYEVLRLVTQGPLFAAERWRAILRLNLAGPLAP